MPIVRFNKLDVFAFIDSDSDEAKAFRTYSGYIEAYASLIEQRFPTEHRFERIHKALDRQGRLTRLASKQFRGDSERARSAIVNAWFSEMQLHLVDPDDPGRVRIANHGAPVHAYYATTRMACAWIHVLTQTMPMTHAACLDGVGRLVATERALWPRPWSLQCTALDPKTEYAGFPHDPDQVSNLSRGTGEYDRIAMSLRTTRQRQVKSLVQETKRQTKRDRAPNGEFNRRDAALRPTSVFDFLWRARTRSNYGDPAMYYMGALTDDDVLRYLHDLKVIVESTSFIFEAMIARRANNLLADTASHFIARDRSGLATEVLLPRLAALGLAKAPDRRAG